jgi:hypothetical protein
VQPSNWSTPLPMTLEQIMADPRPASVADILNRRSP